MRWRFSSSRSAKARRTDSTGDPELMCVLLIMLFSSLSRASRVPYSGMMLQATGPQSTFGESIADRLAHFAFRAGPFHQQGKRGDDRNQELTGVPSGRGQLAEVLSL